MVIKKSTRFVFLDAPPSHNIVKNKKSVKSVGILPKSHCGLFICFYARKNKARRIQNFPSKRTQNYKVDFIV